MTTARYRFQPGPHPLFFFIGSWSAFTDPHQSPVGIKAIVL